MWRLAAEDGNVHKPAYWLLVLMRVSNATWRRLLFVFFFFFSLGRGWVSCMDNGFVLDFPFLSLCFFFALWVSNLGGKGRWGDSQSSATLSFLSQFGL